MVDKKGLQELIERIILNDREETIKGDEDDVKEISERIMTFVELYTDDNFIKK